MQFQYCLEIARAKDNIRGPRITGRHLPRIVANDYRN